MRRFSLHILDAATQQAAAQQPNVARAQLDRNYLHMIWLFMTLEKPVESHVGHKRKGQSNKPPEELLQRRCERLTARAGLAEVLP
jgi:hypothetical protein